MWNFKLHVYRFLKIQGGIKISSYTFFNLQKLYHTQHGDYFPRITKCGSLSLYVSYTCNSVAIKIKGVFMGFPTAMALLVTLM